MAAVEKRQPPEEISDTDEGSSFSWRALLEIVQALALAVIISVFLNLFVVQVTEVRGRSMEPTLRANDRVLVSKVDYRIGTPQVGDIIVFDPPVDSSIPYVKRVIAVAGDVVDVRDGQVYVNGKARVVPEAVTPTTVQSPQIHYPYTIPPGEVWTMGDNRPSSSDSRTYGPDKVDAIIGKVTVRFWPLDRLHFFEW